MNTANIVTSRATAEDARRIGVKQYFPGHFIDIMPRDEKDFFPLNIRCFNRPPQMSPCICGKIFVCINEHNPIPCGMGKRRIARRSKVICPRKFIDRASIGLRDCHGVVMRARINDDELIHSIPEAFDGFFQMHSVIAHNIAGTKAECMLS